MARVVGWLEAVGAVLLFAMMGVVFVDVVGRYALRRPLTGSTELVQVLLALCVACILPSITRRGEHIGIGLFDHAQPGRLERVRRALVAAVGAATFAALAWLLWGHARETAANGDVIGYLRLPVAPLVHAMAVLCGVTAATFAAVSAAAIRNGHGASPQAPEGPATRSTPVAPVPPAPMEKLS
jgi:TRAP-type C4-dicarboxylate transport system permease small subunit